MRASNDMIFAATMKMTPSDPAPASPLAQNRTLRICLGVAVALLFVCYLWFVRTRTAYFASDSDASGYFNTAKLLTQPGLVQPVPRIAGLTPPDWTYYYQQPLGFTIHPDKVAFTATYPVGLPLHFLAAAPFVGGLDYAAILVNVALAGAALLLLFVLGRQLGLPVAWALAGAALLAVCPLWIYAILRPMSDACATVWTLASLVFALLHRRHWAWGFAAGLAYAVGVLVRPTNLLLLLPLAFVLGTHVRAWLAFLVGGLPGALFLAWYNYTVYGGVLTTGYGQVGHLFGLQFVPHNFLHFLHWHFLLLTPFVFLPAFALPWLFRTARSTVILLGLWALSFLGFYIFYFHTGETWWYLRFVLPAFPAVILAALLVAHRYFTAQPRPAFYRWGPLLLLVVALGWEIQATRGFYLATTKQGERAYLEAAEWMQAHVPANAIILEMQVSGAFAYYTSFTTARWDLMDRPAWARLRAAARASGRPIYATLFDFEEPRLLSDLGAAGWERVTRVRHINVWRFQDPAPAPSSR